MPETPSYLKARLVGLNKKIKSLVEREKHLVRSLQDALLEKALLSQEVERLNTELSKSSKEIDKLKRELKKKTPSDSKSSSSYKKDKN